MASRLEPDSQLLYNLLFRNLEELKEALEPRLSNQDHELREIRSALQRIETALLQLTMRRPG